MVIEVEIFVRSMPAKSRSISSMESMATPTLPTSPMARGLSESRPIWVGRSKATDRPVVPSASTAAIITLSVPRTVGPNFPRKFTTAPVNFGANTLMLPPSTRTAEPSASNPFKCKSIGRSPMTQPPGNETVASLQRPRSGPITQTDARIRRTTS